MLRLLDQLMPEGDGSWKTRNFTAQSVDLRVAIPHGVQVRLATSAPHVEHKWEDIVMKEIKLLSVIAQTGSSLILSKGRHYACPTTEIDGEPQFKFKNKWHKVSDYKDEDTIDRW